jgi:hypothetical protein
MGVGRLLTPMPGVIASLQNCMTGNHVLATKIAVILAMYFNRELSI